MKLWRRPLDAAQKAPKRVKVDIDVNRCKGCGYCAEFCPRGVLKMSDKRSSKGYETVEIVDEDKCLGCGLCEAMCPEFGIRLIEKDKEETKEPVAHAK
jgi:2-oxoglutarate ferredoxin oxidoreductase subunit delta